MIIIGTITSTNGIMFAIIDVTMDVTAATSGSAPKVAGALQSARNSVSAVPKNTNMAPRIRMSIASEFRK